MREPCLSGITTMNTVSTPRLDTRGIAAFVAIAYGFSWLCALGYVLGFGTDLGKAPIAFRAIAAVSMFGPALATWLTGRFISPLPSLKRDTGLVIGQHPLRFSLLAVLGTPVVVLASFALSALIYPEALDLTGLSGLRAQLAQLPPEALEKIERELGGLRVLLLLLVMQAVVMGPFINGLFAFGEEWGWRGYLLERLRPLGQWRALVLSGAIWGLWHAPFNILGYNYAQHRATGFLLFTVFCVLSGILFGWMRLATGSIWPAVLAHGSVNALAPVIAVLGYADKPMDLLKVGLTGWPGWLVLAALVGVLALTRRLPVRDLPGEQPRDDAPGGAHASQT
jgi:membrane protease YdiL (CAAX protease family)